LATPSKDFASERSTQSIGITVLDDNKIMTLTMLSGENGRKKEAAAMYKVSVSLKFLLGCVGMGMGVSFFLGCVAKDQISKAPSYALQRQLLVPEATFDFASSLPNPVLGASRKLPNSTSYSTKRYKTEGTASESFLVRSTDYRISDQLQVPSSTNSIPTRQWFSLDLSGISQQSLKSRLSTEADVVILLKEIMATSTNTILSYHCDKVNPGHTTCVGLATQGHIIIHISPTSISIDVHGISLEEEAVKTILGQPLKAKAVLTRSAPKTIRKKALRDTRLASAFINPAMLASQDAQTVVLVGGSVASLTQILKHVAVKRVILLDMDPVWNTDGTDRSRIEQHNETALEWLAASHDGTVDAIFVESPGLINIVPAATRVLHNVNGVLVVKASIQSEKHRIIKAQWIQAILDEEDSYHVIKDYDEGETSFVVAWLDDLEIGKWFASEAEIKLAIREKILPPFDSVDAADILACHVPSRKSEDAFCAANPKDEICINGHGLDPERKSAPISFFEVKLSTVENAGRGLYATRDIEEGTYTFVDTCVENIHFTDATYRIIEAVAEETENFTIPLTAWNILLGYADGYGFSADYQGINAHDVDPSIATFTNHGCNGTENSGEVMYRGITEYEYSAYKETAEAHLTIYNPARDRSLRTSLCSGDVTLRDIEEGEEIFNNYLFFVDIGDLDEFAGTLRAECEGRTIGQISEYEMSANSNRILHAPGALHLRSNITKPDLNMSHTCRLCGIAQDNS
jgi:hypothetical protein